MTDEVAARIAQIRDRAENGSMRQVVTEDVPRLLAVAEGVLKLHRPEPTDWGDVCAGCWGRMGKNAWPCPTYRIAAAALLAKEAPADD